MFSVASPLSSSSLEPGEMELVYHGNPMTLPNTERDPCGLPLASFLVEAPLVLRSAAELSSESRGILRRGDKVVALDEAVHSGVRRTLVALETSLQQPLGWVTREKHGKELLKTMRSKPGAHGFYSSIVGFEIFGRKSPPKGNGRTTLSDSLASRVARRRLGTSTFEGRRSSSATGGSTSLVSPEASPSPKGTITAKAGAGGKGAKPQYSAAKIWQAAEQITRRAEGFKITISDTFESKLANVLVQKKVKVEELVRSWDRNGDGVINKNEFRVAVRGYGFKEINVLEIDGLFDKIDNDKSGELDLSEIKAALKKLQEQALNVGVSVDQEKAKTAALIGVAQVFQTAAAATAEYEAAAQKATQMKDNPSLGKRVGDAILKRNVKLGELVGQWDKDGNGVVDKKEFREQIHLMGIKEIHPREMDSLFVSLDRNGDGSLDLDELKVALQLLRDTAVREALVVEAQAGAALKLCAASRKQQKVRQEYSQ